MSGLPIHDVAAPFLQALLRSNRVILQAPTGSGKSTQAPQLALDALEGPGQIVVLQPRRLAARLLARRVAEERGCRLGGEVGYQVRFENVTGPETRIRYVTEGVLLREIIHHPELENISAVFFDEFHERHLFGDVMLALLTALQERRTGLRLVVMSATLDGPALADYLAPCESVCSAGRQYDVECIHLPRPVDFKKQRVGEIAADVTARALSRQAGHTLIFMPGAYEINQTIRALQARPECKGFEILPLYGDLPPDQQDRAVQTDRAKRRIVVATNVAETSITIEGVTLVVDSGLVRTARYDPHRGIDTLRIESISRASADQRAGRAGRTAPGTCLRLWTRQEHQNRPQQQEPEIHRHDLAEILLSLKALGINDCRRLRWLEPPPDHAMSAAETFLRNIGAINEEGAITSDGHRMQAFPLHPRHARLLLAAGQLGCVREICLIAALMQGRNLFMRTRQTDARERLLDELAIPNPESDLILAAQVLEHVAARNFDFSLCERLGVHAGAARTAQALFRQFAGIAGRCGLRLNSEDAPSERIRQCLMAGLIDRLAIRLDQGSLRCQLMQGRRGELERSSLARGAPLLVAAEITELESGASRETGTLLSQATAIREEWLREAFPADFRETEETCWDAAAKRAKRRRSLLFRDLPLETRMDDHADPEATGKLLAAEIQAGRIKLARWNQEVEQWILRVNLLARYRPEWDIPPISGQDVQTILEDLCHGCSGARDLKDKPVMPAVKAWLSPAQQALVEQMMPTRFQLPSGRKAPIEYRADAPPTLRATIQDLYGLEASPRLADGRLTVCLEILAPNRRPVQLTDDLASFWLNRYPAIKQELRRKYHKHEWR